MQKTSPINGHNVCTHCTYCIGRERWWRPLSSCSTGHQFVQLTAQPVFCQRVPAPRQLTGSPAVLRAPTLLLCALTVIDTRQDLGVSRGHRVVSRGGEPWVGGIEFYQRTLFLWEGHGGHQVGHCGSAVLSAGGLLASCILLIYRHEHLKRGRRNQKARCAKLQQQKPRGALCNIMWLRKSQKVGSVHLDVLSGRNVSSLINRTFAQWN